MATPYDPIQEAFERAKLEFKGQLQDDSLYDEILETKSIDQVYDATDKLQEEQAKSGHMRHLSKIEPYLTHLNDYANAVGVFVQVKPDVLALIWGPIVLLLQWASVLKKSFDAIVNTTAEIGLALPEFQRAVQLFDKSDNIKDVLLLFFKDILDFYVVAIKFFRLPRWKFLFEALWPKHRDKIKVVTTHIERHTFLMRRDVQYEHIRQEHEARARALEHFESMEKANRRQEYHNIKTDISPKMYGNKVNMLQSQTYEGTAKWLLKDATFTSWLDFSDKSARLLWLQGIPGAGKTFLSSTVVGKTKTLARTLFAFLSYTEASSTSALSILHSLIFQLASDDDDLQTAMCELSRENLGNSISVAYQILSSLLLCAGSIFIVIDGLDEIDEVERSQLVKYLTDLLKDCEEIKVLISSRPEADLKTMLGDQAQSIQVDTRNAGSIQAFVRQWTEDWFRKRDFPPQAKVEIERLLAPLASKAKGMFLYAKVVLNSIEFLDDITEIGNELNVLPETLDAAYSRILSRVNGLDPSPLKDKARKLLGWISCSPSPMTVQEIQRALAIRLDDREGKARLFGDLQIDKICGPIVEVADDHVQFVHFTVKEYISSPHIKECIDDMESIVALAKCCLAYLCQEHHDPDLREEEISEKVLDGTYILHEFATTTWPELVERSLRLCPKNTPPPPDLITVLEVMLFDRTNDEYDGKSEDIIQPGIQVLKNNWPELHDMVSKAINFRHICSTSLFMSKEESIWTNLDPLTTSRTSIRIQKVVESLLYGDFQEHGNLLKKHYGSRPFKCHFIYCIFRRQGFETRAARNAHEKYHDRPWKCSVPTCEYANGGFLSRKMRDDHLDRYHQAQKSEKNLSLFQPDPDELQPLAFDLFEANNVDAIKALMPSFKSLSDSVIEELRQIAAISGSASLLKLSIEGFPQTQIKDKRQLTRSAIRNRNLETLEYLFGQWPHYGSLDALREVLVSETPEITELWQKHMDDRIRGSDAGKAIKGGASPSRSEVQGLALLFTAQYDLSAATGHPHREDLILSFWRRYGIVEALQSFQYIGDALVNVAQTCCSVKLAKFLIEAGAKVDYRRNDTCFTPLHHAARKTSAEASELMEYLLLCGADPEIRCIRMLNGKAVTIKNRIRDEKGAQGIFKWLGVSWDELVARTKKEREERQAETDPNSQ